ncbi:MAG: phosphoglucomutase/phosphomannomutase family protein [Chloroflexi bacterium]|nr:phosphoglucomutase/phosphomannomutase family protein [Chloroflexota bacterium]
MAEQIKFGTDGWRGAIADDYTFENVRRCAQGFANYFAGRGGAPNGIVVGFDKRFASEYFAAAAAEVLAANGIKVYLCHMDPDGATPTPVISYTVVALKADGAVNITASHNPPTDNGFKVRGNTGGAIDPEGLKQIEAGIPPPEDVKQMPMEQALSQGLVRRINPAPQYIEHLKYLIDLAPIRNAGLHVAVDAMWGNGAGWFPNLIGGGATRITEIHNVRNPIFPEMKRPEPIQPNVDKLLETVVRIQADAGVITDGDADRVGFADENGRFVNQLEVYGLLALYLLEVRGWRGPIVKTLSTTSMLNKLARRYNVPIYETGVGFKYVAPKMVETNAMIGGEESGGFAFRGHVPERDGILAGLFLLDMMVKTGKKPSQLLAWLFELVGPHYYDRIDISYDESRRPEFIAKVKKAQPDQIAGLKVERIDATDGFKFDLGDNGWMLIRFSGTEPIIRVYTETTHQDKVESILRDGIAILGLPWPVHEK